MFDSLLHRKSNIFIRNNQLSKSNLDPNPVINYNGQTPGGKQVKIRTRLMILNILFIAGIIGTTAIFYYEQAVQKNILETVQTGTEVKADLFRTNALTKELLLTSNLKTGYNNFNAQYAQMMASLELFRNSSQYRKLILADENGRKREASLDNIIGFVEKKITEVDGQLQSLFDTYPAYLPGLYDAYQFYGDVDINIASSEVVNLTVYLGDSFERTLNELISFLQKRADEQQNLTRLISFVLVGLLLLFVLFLSLGMVRKLQQQLIGLKKSMEVLATGDFSRRLVVKGRDELSSLAESMNRFIDDFSSVIDEVKTISVESAELKDAVNSATNESAAAVQQMSANISSISNQINNLVENLTTSDQASKRIAEGINSLVDKIENQSSAVTQSSSSIEEMTASIESVARIARQRQEASEALVEITAKGGEQVAITNKLIEENASDVKEILEVIEIINNVASQTNLLSMNAAIEAAHAGESGRGFAVVAEEIRKLAESTNENSKRIRKTITTIADRIQQILESSNESSDSFQAIDSETKQNSQAMAEIASTMKELSLGSNEIMDAMNSLSNSTQEIQDNSELMRESTIQVSDAVTSITGIGDQVRDGIMEIEAGAKDISGAMENVNELNEKSSESIDQLHAQVDRFKTACGEEDELSESIEGDIEKVCAEPDEEMESV